MTATVVTKIDDQAIDTFFFEICNQSFYIPGGTGGVFVAIAQRAVIPIETRHVNNADGPFATVPGHFDDFTLGRLLFELDLSSCQAELLVAVTSQGACRNDLQSDDSVGRATNQVDDIVEAPSNHVHHRAVSSLGNADDLIFGTQ